MLRFLKYLGVLFLGVIIGVGFMSYLASRASHMFSRNLEISYSFEQQRQAALAAKNGQWLAATTAYHNMAEVESRDGKPFGVKNQEWNLLFPFASLILERIVSVADHDGKGKRISIGISHARYALALEKSGYVEDASVEWAKSIEYGSFKSIDSARNLALDLLKQDIEFFSTH